MAGGTTYAGAAVPLLWNGGTHDAGTAVPFGHNIHMSGCSAVHLAERLAPHESGRLGELAVRRARGGPPTEADRPIF